MIPELAYILDCLRTLQEITKNGSCNSCGNKECQWKPEWVEQKGETVRIAKEENV